MRPAILSGFIAFTFALGGPGLQSEEDAVQTPSEIVSGYNAFACALYAQRAAQPGNRLCAPFSVARCLDLILAGAQGPTRDEIRKALGYPAPDDELWTSLVTFGEEVGQESVCATATGLWASKHFAFNPDFFALCQGRLGAELARLDFTRSDAAAARINAWVAAKTDGAIETLINPEYFRDNPPTVVVVTSSLLFCSQWMLNSGNGFPTEDTAPAVFHAPAGDRQVPFMHLVESLVYHAFDHCQMAVLPYAYTDYEMVVLLPRRERSLADVEALISADRIKRWRERCVSTPLRIAFPRFSFADDCSLRDDLRQLGIRTAFTSRADLSGMTDGEGAGWFIDQVLHETCIEVDEQQTRAAAATGVYALMGVTSPPKNPRSFRCDRPFLFLIRHTPTGAILFIGRLVDPPVVDRE